MRTVRSLAIAAILAACILNAAHAARQFYHWPVFLRDALWYREASVLHTRDVINGLGTTRLAYLPGTGVADPGAFFEVQYLLAPVVLARNSMEGSFVLVDFGNGNPAGAMPGLVLVEDFKNGLALFRRQG